MGTLRGVQADTIRILVSDDAYYRIRKEQRADESIGLGPIVSLLRICNGGV